MHDTQEFIYKIYAYEKKKNIKYIKYLNQLQFFGNF